jgi:hypothetical protein
LTALNNFVVAEALQFVLEHHVSKFCEPLMFCVPILFLIFRMARLPHWVRILQQSTLAILASAAKENTQHYQNPPHLIAVVKQLTTQSQHSRIVSVFLIQTVVSNKFIWLIFMLGLI